MFLQRVYLLILFAIGSITSSFCQQNDTIVDVLNQRIEAAESDSIKIQYQIELVEEVRNHDINTALEVLEEVLSVIDGKKNPSRYFLKQKSLAYNYLGILDSNRGELEESITNHLKALKIRENILDTTGISQTYHNLGMSYRRLKDYSKSKEFFKKAIKLREQCGTIPELAGSNNMLGVSYYYALQNDSALIHYTIAKGYYEKAINYDKSVEKIAGVNGNIATIYYTEKKYDLMIPIYKENIKIFSELNKLSEVGTFNLNLAILYHDLGKYNLSRQYVKDGIAAVRPIGHKELLSSFHKLNTWNYERLNNNTKALESYRIHRAYLDSIIDIEKAKRIIALDLNYEFEKEQLADSLEYASEKKLSIARIENLDSKNKIQLQWMIFGGAGLIILALYFLSRYRNRIRLTRLENQMLVTEVEFKKQDLANMAINLSQNKEWAQKLMDKLKKLKVTRGKQRVKELVGLEQEIGNKIWVDGDTDEIHDKIDILSSAFYKKLNTQFKDLSKTEIRMCSLIRMNMSTKEIAILQNIHPFSVKKSRNRLRKKLQLSPEADLNTFLHSF